LNKPSARISGSATIRGYILQVAQFAKHFGKSPDQLGAEHIRTYQLFLVKEGRLSQSTYIQVVSALRFLYTQTLNRQVSIERIPFPRRERKLPIRCGLIFPMRGAAEATPHL